MNGYVSVRTDHGTKLQHRLIVEAITGKPLPPKAIIHHWDENPRNNTPSNLVICPDEAYHKLLHARMRAMKATGDPNKRKCAYCKQWDSTDNMSPFMARGYHKSCAAKYQRERKARKAV